jgi:hypothetical protein
MTGCRRGKQKVQKTIHWQYLWHNIHILASYHFVPGMLFLLKIHLFPNHLLEVSKTFVEVVYNSFLWRRIYWYFVSENIFFLFKKDEGLFPCVPCPGRLSCWNFFIYIFYLFIFQNYTTVLKFIRFDHQPPWPTAVGALTAIGHGGRRSNRHRPRRLGQHPEFIFSGGPTNQPPARPSRKLRHFSRKIATLRASCGWNPQPLVSPEASLATTIHNHMCLYSVSFLLILYLAGYKLLFKALNGIK